MKLRERLNEQLKKVRALPEKTRKIIFWSIIITATIILIWLWLWQVSHIVKSLDLNDFEKKFTVPTENLNTDEIKNAQEEFSKGMGSLLSTTSTEQDESATSSQNQ